jgi:hypothetical protein
MIVETAQAATDPVPWDAILGVGGTVLGAVVGGVSGWLVARSQGREETKRQTDRLTTEQAQVNADWVRSHRVQGYVDFLQVIDHYHLWTFLHTANPAVAATLRSPSREEIQSALSLVALYGPESVREKSAAANEAAGSYQLNPSPEVEAEFTAARDAYIMEVRRQLSVE